MTRIFVTGSRPSWLDPSNYRGATTNVGVLVHPLASLSGLMTLIDARYPYGDFTLPADGGALPHIHDLSGNDEDFTTSVGGSGDATWDADGIYGGGAFKVGSPNLIPATESMTLPSSFTLYVVAQVAANTSDIQGIVNADGGTRYFQFGIANMHLRAQLFAPATYQGQADGSGTIMADTPFVGTFARDGNGTVMRLDGISDYSGAQALGNTATRALTLGNAYDGPNGLMGTGGRIALVAFCSGRHDVSTMEATEEYLMTTFGIS